MKINITVEPPIDILGNDINLGDILVSASKYGGIHLSKVKGFTEKSITTLPVGEIKLNPTRIPLNRTRWWTINLSKLKI